MSEIIGHGAIVRSLEHAAMRPAPGYVFHGPDGVGKRGVARWFAARLLVSDIGQLPSHPDYLLLKREEGAHGIPVESVRELVARMHLTSARGGRKVALMEDAEQLNEAGMNVLLKAVEEPDGDTTYVFVTEEPERLPATLRSRLVSIAFGPISSEELKTWLTKQTTDPSLLERVANASRGRPGLAKRLLQEPERWEERTRLARRLLEAMTRHPGTALTEIERVAKTLGAATDTESAWREFLSECERLLAETVKDPGAFSRIAHGLILARRFAGGAIPTHLGLEWAVLAPYHGGEVPSFLQPSYL